MQLDWAVSCDSYEWRYDGTVDIESAGIDTIYVDDLPEDIDITILVRLLMAEGETAEIAMEVWGPDMAPLGRLPQTINATPGPNYRPGFIVSQIEELRAGFTAEAEGTYSAEIYTTEARGDPTSEKYRRSLFYTVRLGPAP